MEDNDIKFKKQKHTAIKVAIFLKFHLMMELLAMG
jgi:hypothetical protein